MTLFAGTRFGPYEVADEIGAGLFLLCICASTLVLALSASPRRPG